MQPHTTNVRYPVRTRHLALSRNIGASTLTSCRRQRIGLLLPRFWSNSRSTVWLKEQRYLVHVPTQHSRLTCCSLLQSPCTHKGVHREDQRYRFCSYTQTPPRPRSLVAARTVFGLPIPRGTPLWGCRVLLCAAFGRQPSCSRCR